MDVRELKFVNSDARPKTTVVRCDADSIAHIMAWYGAYFASDRYAVFVDGEKVTKDGNGCLTSSAATLPLSQQRRASGSTAQTDPVQS